MQWCCPGGHGCNAPNGNEPCALEICRTIAGWESEASVALARWEALQSAIEQGCSEGERRFRRRAYRRARDKALIAEAMRALPPSGDVQPAAAGCSSPARRTRSRQLSARKRGGAGNAPSPAVG